MQTWLQKNLLDPLPFSPAPPSAANKFATCEVHSIQKFQNDSALHYVILYSNRIKCHEKLNLNHWIQSLVLQILHYGQTTKYFKKHTESFYLLPPSFLCIQIASISCYPSDCELYQNTGNTFGLSERIRLLREHITVDLCSI